MEEGGDKRDIEKILPIEYSGPSYIDDQYVEEGSMVLDARLPLFMEE